MNRTSILKYHLLFLIVFALVAACGCFMPGTVWSQSLATAVLPTSRSVQVGDSATAFASIINTGANTATACSLAAITSVTADFFYQTTDPTTNELTGTRNTPVDIEASTLQTFLFAFVPHAPFDPTDVQLSFDCANTDQAPITVGLNTLRLSASSTPVPDIIALVATSTEDGIINLPETTSANAFSVATVNVGASGTITASADTGNARLPLSLSICKTDPGTGGCTSDILSSVTTTIGANATPTFSVFLGATDNIPFDPANNRIFVRFRDAGATERGSTSVATRTASTFLLSVTPAGNGNGTVTSVPSGINCGTDCSQQYASDTQVTLTANPSTGSTFTGWSGGGCSGTTPCTVTMNQARPITANFTLQPRHTLTLQGGGTGSGTVSSNPGGINCSISGASEGGDCSESYNLSTSVTLTANPSTGSTFTGWSGGCSGTTPCTVTMNQASNVTASFALQTRTLTVQGGGTGSGTVSSNPGGINCSISGTSEGGDCSEGYDFGTSVTLTASPSKGSSFTGWSGGGCSGTGLCTVTMNQAHTVTANFTISVPSTSSITVQGGGTGSGTVSSNPSGINCSISGTSESGDCSESYNLSTSVTLTASPSTGSSFTGWSGGGCSGTSPCTVTMNEARNVTASFALQTHTLTVQGGGDGNGTVSSTPSGINCSISGTAESGDCSEGYKFGTSVTLTASPSTGSTFTGWSGSGCSGTGSCTVTMDQAHTVAANFVSVSGTSSISGIVDARNNIFPFPTVSLEGYTLILRGPACPPNGDTCVFIDSTTTGQNNGDYEFTGLPTGTFELELQGFDPAIFTFSLNPTISVILSDNTESTHNLIGTVNPNTIVGCVFLDGNPVQGMTVQLLLGTTVLDTISTDAGGHYYFAVSSVPQTYTMRIIPSSVGLSESDFYFTQFDRDAGGGLALVLGTCFSNFGLLQ